MTTPRSQEEIIRAANDLLPRLLTQASRDPRHSHFGCFDRNFWHYHIRDFPSIILQQGGLACHAMSTLDPVMADTDLLERLARASVGFWNDRAQRRGAFEEYYPFEMGYPPLAFSTLATTALIRSGVAPVSEALAGLEVAGGQLTSRFEAEAGNQQVAGLAALAGVRAVAPQLVSGAELETVAARTFALQHTEGWFPEYDGPDVGYLAVAIDCLWDYFDVTADPRAMDSIDRAIGFISTVIGDDHTSTGMLNSRNTDYVVPYGLVRSAQAGRSTSGEAALLLDQLFGSIDSEHFLAALDDRYLCHYLGTSVMRAAAAFSSPASATPDTPTRRDESFWILPGAGLALWERQGSTVRAALSKGGIVTIVGQKALADFGFDVEIDGRLLVTHWWADSWQFDASKEGFNVAGPLYEAPSVKSSPTKHVGLRLASAVAGPRLISLLKSKMIFASPDPDLRFERKVLVEDDHIEIVDRISGLSAGSSVFRSSRSSMRHVASADSFHREDGLNRQRLLAPVRNGVIEVSARHPLSA